MIVRVELSNGQQFVRLGDGGPVVDVNCLEEANCLVGDVWNIRTPLAIPEPPYDFYSDAFVETTSVPFRRIR